MDQRQYPQYPQQPGGPCPPYVQQPGMEYPPYPPYGGQGSAAPPYGGPVYGQGGGPVPPRAPAARAAFITRSVCPSLATTTISSYA